MGTGTAGRVQVQFMVLVSQEQRDRMDALRLAAGVSRAQQVREALDADLTRQETLVSDKLTRLIALAAKVGMTVDDFTRAVVENRRFGIPTLSALESMKRVDLDKEIAPRRGRAA